VQCRKVHTKNDVGFISDLLNSCNTRNVTDNPATTDSG
jgi:hypothetical protein